MKGKRYNKQEIIEVLRPFLELGMSVTRACNCAGIPQSTVATWSSENEVVRLKIASMQNLPTAKALQNIVEKIKDGDLKASMWWLERKEKREFGLQITNGPDIASGPIEIIIGGGDTSTQTGLQE